MSSKNRDKKRSRRSNRTEKKDKGRNKKRFKYQTRSHESVETRSKQSGYASKEPICTDDYKFYSVKDDNNIRILPPTWDDADHYGFDLYIHYQIGSDSGNYICPEKMGSGDCPICEEKRKAEKGGDEEYAKTLNATKRPTVLLIDRDKEDDGVQIWPMPWTVDRDLAALCLDKQTGEILMIDDPYDGYDVSFDRTGKALKTKYIGLQVSRHSSEAMDDSDELNDVLEAIQDKTLKDVLIIHDYDYLEDVFSGHSKNKNKKEDKDDKEKEEPEYTYEEIMDMDFDELEEIIDDEGLDDLDIDDYEEDDDDDLEELAKDICKELGLKKKKSNKKDKKRMRDMR
jgi:hypothetical protein